jgi:hypothetical protein
MKAPHRNFLIREADGVREADTLVLGTGMILGQTAGGLPELLGVVGDEAYLQPSGGDDTQAIRDALARAGSVRLGPGTFNVSETIALGTTQRVSGCGAHRTLVRSTVTGAAFSLTGAGITIEDLDVRGLGENIETGTVGIKATSVTDLRLRGLRLGILHRCMTLLQCNQVAISDVTAYSSYYSGISLTGPGTHVVIADVYGDGVDGWVIDIASMDCVSCTGVFAFSCGTGIRVSGCSSLDIQGVRVYGCNEGLVLLSTRGAQVGGVHANQCTSGIRVEGSLAVTLNGCAMGHVEGTSLTLRNCTAATVSGLLSDRTGQTQAVPPHVLVDGGSTQVVLSGVQRINPPVPPQYEVDVSAAGGRVVFIQHNFDPARINSGGNFVAL